MTLDDKRPEAVARRRKTNQRTARQNLDDLVDPGSFVEYGAFAIASQRTRRTIEDLIERTPADGLITGIGRVNGSLFGPERSRVAVAHYDYTVLAGTQGKTNHHKKDRLFEIVEKQRIPLVFFTEGGGGRPGDVDVQSVAGLNTMAFHIFGPAERAGAAGRHQLRPLLCRQCRDPRLLRRGDRHEELVDRHGRPGDDRGRQSRRLLARGSGPDERAGAQRHGRHRRRRRGRGGRGRQEVPLLLPGPAAGMAGGRPAAAAPRHPREPPARLRRARRDRDAVRRGLGARAAPRLRPRHGDGARPHRGQAARHRRQQPDASRRRHRLRTAPTRPRASCSSATPSTSRSCSSATRPASWSGRRSRRPRWCATARGCS